VDCNNLLAHNCQQAALTMMNDHRQLVNDPSRTHSIEYTPGGGGAGCGIYYGSEIHKLLPKYLAYLDGTLAPGDRDYKVVQREMDQALSSYSREVLRTYLAQRNTALNADITKFGLKPNNCVFYQMDATETGHEQSNAKGVWTKIHDRYEKAEKLKEHGHGPGGTGDQLFKGFEDAGWVGIYYNPDICNPFDKFTQPENATHHINSYKTWISTGQYTHLPAPVGIINYDPTLRYQAANEARKDGSGDLVDTLTNMDTSQLDKLANVPYGVLIARDAYHTALIILGKVYEVHWEKFPDDPNLFAATDLKDWDWLDGMLMVPKGFWT
jgi:hypothetical protein